MPQRAALSVFLEIGRNIGYLSLNLPVGYGEGSLFFGFLGGTFWVEGFKPWLNRQLLPTGILNDRSIYYFELASVVFLPSH